MYSIAYFGAIYNDKYQLRNIWERQPRCPLMKQCGSFLNKTTLSTDTLREYLTRDHMPKTGLDFDINENYELGFSEIYPEFQIMLYYIWGLGGYYHIEVVFCDIAAGNVPMFILQRLYRIT